MRAHSQRISGAGVHEAGGIMIDVFAAWFSGVTFASGLVMLIVSYRRSKLNVRILETAQKCLTEAHETRERTVQDVNEWEERICEIMEDCDDSADSVLRRMKVPS